MALGEAISALDNLIVSVEKDACVADVAKDLGNHAPQILMAVSQA